MVKFLSFDLFDSQNVLPSDHEDYEPVDVIAALNDFLVSSAAGEIIHYSIGASDSTILNRFHTVNSKILQLHYVPANDSILTLEKDSNSSKINVVRNSGEPASVQLHVYKLPVPSSVTAIHVCPVTSRVIVATEKSVSVWAAVNTGSVFVSAFERILDIDAEGVLHVAIYEGFVGYSTRTDVKILALNIHYQEPIVEPIAATLVVRADAEAVHGGPSSIVEDEHYFEVSFDALGNPTGKNQLSCLQTSGVIGSDDSEHEIIGPITDIDHGINVNSESGYALLSSTLVLSRRFSSDDNLHSLFFLPDSLNDAPDMRTTTPAHVANKVAMRCVISTQKQGFIYNITKPTLLATYLYANETFLCSASHSFLYTLTIEGLETWTLRSCDGADDGNDTPPPCGVGIRTFMPLTKIAIINDYVVLLSKFSMDQVSDNARFPGIMRSPARASPKRPQQPVSPAMDTIKGLSKPSQQVWSVYILHHTPLQSLYTQILEYATKNQEKDEEYFLKNQEDKDYMRAALWYSSSDTDIELVFNLLSETPQSHKALSYYLKQVLFNPSTVELLANKEDLSNKILRHYHSESPHNLSVLILESSVSSYSQTLAIDLLKNLSEQCDFDLEQRNNNYFALGLLYLDQNNIDQTMLSLNQIPVDSLISLCLKNPKLLAPMGEEDPTALGKILRQTIPWGLLEITINLVKKKEISPDDGFTILLHSTTTFPHELVPSFIKYLIHLYVQDIHRFRGDDKQLFESLNIDIPMIINSTSTKPSKQQSSQLNNKILTKLQSLLSTTRVHDFEFMDNVEAMFANDTDNIMFVSLKLACYPLLERMAEGIQLVIDTKHTGILLEYGLHFCHHNDWSIMLDKALKHYLLAPEADRTAILDEYERLLDYLTSYMDPEAFLQLLPGHGKMDYFLPFIEKSFTNHHAKMLKTRLSDYLVNDL
eukprot:gene12161-14233_t